MIMAITAHSTVDPGRIPQVTRVHVSGCILCHCFYTCEVLHVVYDTYMCVYLNHQPISAVGLYLVAIIRLLNFLSL